MTDFFFGFKKVYKTVICQNCGKKKRRLVHKNHRIKHCSQKCYYEYAHRVNRANKKREAALRSVS